MPESNLFEDLRKMGWFAAPNRIFRDPALGLYERSALLFLYRSAGTDGSSWPSYQRIADQTGMSRRRAIQAVDALEQTGWLIVERGNIKRKSNLYRLSQPVKQQESGWFGSPDGIFGDPGLGLHERAVLLFLYRMAGTDGSSWPSYQMIAEETGMSRQRAIQAIAALEQAGWISVEYRNRKSKPNIYQLIRSASESGSFVLNDEGVQDMHQGGHPHVPRSTGHAPGGSTRCTHGVNQVHPKDYLSKDYLEKDHLSKKDDDDSVQAGEEKYPEETGTVLDVGSSVAPEVDDSPVNGAGNEQQWRDEVASLFFSLTGSLWDYTRDRPTLDRIRSIASPDQILTAIRFGTRRYKPRFKGDRIRSFAYFVPIVKQLVAGEKIRRGVVVGHGASRRNSPADPGRDRYEELYIGGTGEPARDRRKEDYAGLYIGGRD